MNNLIKSLSGLKILCIGDVMLDRFTKGNVNRVAPEAPISVLLHDTDTDIAGGVGNVACNLASLGVQTTLLSVVGDDSTAQDLESVLNGYGVNTDLFVDSSRPTTLKQRFGTSLQDMMRMDREKTHPIDKGLEQEILKRFDDLLPQFDVIILSDYTKGVLTNRVLRHVIDCANKTKKPVLVDPKGDNYSKYAGATCITPNRQALAFASRENDVEAGIRQLESAHQIQNVIATLSEDGAAFVNYKNNFTIFEATARSVKNVSGAGDCFMAGLAIELALQEPLEMGVILGNILAGLAVEKADTSVITRAELQAALHDNTMRDIAPVAENWDQAKAMIDEWKAQGLHVGQTGGCFDIVHQGHVTYLAKAAAQCDKLIVAMNVDESVKRLKGETRPVNDLHARACVIGALGSVDLVVPFASNPEEDDKPVKLVEFLQPDILFKGADYTVDQLPEAKPVLDNGGQVILIDMEEGFSTTNTIAKLNTAKSAA